MIFEICAVVATLLFMLLTFFSIRLLRALERSLNSVNRLTQEVDDKVQQLGSTFKTVSNLGDMCAERTRHMLEAEALRRTYPSDSAEVDDLAELLLVAIKLGIKFLRR